MKFDHSFLKHTGKMLKFRNILFFLTIITVFLAGNVYANNTYQNYFNSEYPASNLVGNCSVCHSSGAPSLDAYGAAWKNAGRNQSAFAPIENQDSDGDGFTNLEEIREGTLPGSSSSHPTVQVNQPPVANAGSDQTVNEGDLVTLDGSGSSDPDDGIASYLWTQTAGTTVSLSNSSSATPTFTAPSTPGSLTFSLTVTDVGGLQSSDTCIVTVNHVNVAPNADAGPNQNVDEGTLVTLNGSGSSDPDDGIASYLWTQTAGTTVSLSNSSSATPAFTAPSTPGSLTFSLKVTDVGGLYSTDTCVITVNHVNMAPTADAGPDQTVNEGDLVNLNGGNSSDPDDGIASYLWTQTTGTTVSLSNPSSATPAFTAPSSSGALTFTLTVTDVGGLHNSDTCLINVTSGNLPPTANAGVDQTVDEGAVVTLNGSNSTDPDDGIISYLWTQTDGKSVTLSDPTAVNPTFTADTAGAFTFNLQVTDAGGLQANDTCIINVAAGNLPPAADAGVDQTVDKGTMVTLDGSNSTDPDDGIVSYLWTQTAGGTVTLSDPTAVNPTFTAPADGPLNFKLTVTDAGGLLANDTCIVNITIPANTAPVADAGTDQTVDEGEMVVLDGSGSTDPDGDSISYMWTQTAGASVTLSDPTAASPDFTAPQEGALTFRLTVTDEGTLQSSDVCTVNVVHVNQPPVADAGASQSVSEGMTVTLDASASTDPDDGVDTFLWNQTGGPSVTLSDPTDYITTFVAPPVNSADVILTFELTVTDIGGLMSTSSVKITVTDNGITGFPDNVVSIKSGDNDMPIGISVDSGGSCTSLTAVDPLSLPDDPGKPDDLVYGLLNFRVKVPTAGSSAVVKIYLSEPAPENYSWCKYNNSTGWEDFGEHAVFSDDRSQVTITIVDGGPGDEDNLANGEIVDPSGLGFMSASPVNSGGGDFGSGGSGCFIATAGYGSSNMGTGFTMGITLSILLLFISFSFVKIRYWIQRKIKK